MNCKPYVTTTINAPQKVVFYPNSNYDFEYISNDKGNVKVVNNGNIVFMEKEKFLNFFRVKK